MNWYSSANSFADEEEEKFDGSQEHKAAFSVYHVLPGSSEDENTLCKGRTPWLLSAIPSKNTKQGFSLRNSQYIYSNLALQQRTSINRKTPWHLLLESWYIYTRWSKVFPLLHFETIGVWSKGVNCSPTKLIDLSQRLQRNVRPGIFPEILDFDFAKYSLEPVVSKFLSETQQFYDCILPENWPRTRDSRHVLEMNYRASWNFFCWKEKSFTKNHFSSEDIHD